MIADLPQPQEQRLHSGQFGHDGASLHKRVELGGCLAEQAVVQVSLFTGELHILGSNFLLRKWEQFLSGIRLLALGAAEHEVAEDLAQALEPLLVCQLVGVRNGLPPPVHLLKDGDPQKADQGEQVVHSVLDGGPRHAPPPLRVERRHRIGYVRVRVAGLVCFVQHHAEPEMFQERRGLLLALCPVPFGLELLQLKGFPLRLLTARGQPVLQLFGLCAEALLPVPGKAELGLQSAIGGEHDVSLLERPRVRVPGLAMPAENLEHARLDLGLDLPLPLSED
mmetsp:Transcript_108137/g.186656  ORF Transcript_108137/g.186656 Transcript_108137/m.186656 type:complete len:280 (+) Transcript_108137:1531-2370(+)